jgi:hypothetical protein
MLAADKNVDIGFYKLTTTVVAIPMRHLERLSVTVLLSRSFLTRPFHRNYSRLHRNSRIITTPTAKDYVTDTQETYHGFMRA